MFFEGQFKKGKPEGRGTWTWKDGHYYLGEFKNGMMDGAGEMHYTKADGSDSMVAVTYSKGKPTKPGNESYTIYNTGGKIDKIKVEKTSATPEIYFELESTSASPIYPTCNWLRANMRNW